MARSLQSAKRAGASFEQDVAAYLADKLARPGIERRHLSGANDRGDITGLFVQGERVVVECKNYGGRVELSAWIRELEIEMLNDKANLGFIVAKRKGTTEPGKQWVAMTLDDLIRFITIV
jgi:hypothetical protein